MECYFGQKSINNQEHILTSKQVILISREIIFTGREIIFTSREFTVIKEDAGAQVRQLLR